MFPIPVVGRATYRPDTREVSLWRGHEIIATQDVSFGLNLLACDQRSLVVAGKRIVLRATEADDDHFQPARLAELRAHDMAVVVTPSQEQTDDSRLGMASDHGVPLIIDARQSTIDERSLRSWGRWPAVSVLLTATPVEPALISRWAPNLLIAHWVETRAAADNCSADLIVVDAGGFQPDDWATFEQPLCVWTTERPGSADSVSDGNVSDQVAAARRACERLQAECAPLTNLAGYWCGLTSKRR